MQRFECQAVRLKNESVSDKNLHLWARSQSRWMSFDGNIGLRNRSTSLHVSQYVLLLGALTVVEWSTDSVTCSITVMTSRHALTVVGRFRKDLTKDLPGKLGLSRLEERTAHKDVWLASWSVFIIMRNSFSSWITVSCCIESKVKRWRC